MNPNFKNVHRNTGAKEDVSFEDAFNAYPLDTPVLGFIRYEISVFPDVSKFKNLDTLMIARGGLLEVPEGIGELENLEMLILCENKLKSLPKSIGKLKNVKFINLADNPITDFPEEIKYLDMSNGGSLFRMAVDKEDIGEENYKRLQELLPNVFLTSLR